MADASPGSARAVVGAAIAAAVERLDAELPRARAGHDPEGVHQARVATRRLRSDLRTFAPMLDEAWRVAMRADLKVLTDALGAVRDLDVLRIRLESAIEQLGIDDAADLLARLDEHDAAERHRLVTVLDSDATADLIARLRTATADPPTTAAAQAAAEDQLRPLARRPWRRLRRAVRSLGQEPPIAELHRVRLLAKRARYAAEAVTPAFGRRARRLAKALAGVQDVLGDLNDAEQTIAWLQEAVDELSPRAAFAAGLLTAHFEQQATEHRHGWERSFRRAERRSDWLD